MSKKREREKIRELSERKANPKEKEKEKEKSEGLGLFFVEI